VVQQRGPLRAGRRLRQRLPRRLQRDRGRHRRARQGHRHQQGPGRYTAAGLAKVYAGSNAASFIGTDPSDGRVPDLIGIVQHGVVYTGKTKKIAEHGGNDPQDRDVPLVISGPSIKHRVQTTQVQTTQIAPTILSLLGLDPHDLEAVVAEGTRGLPLR